MKILFVTSHRDFIAPFESVLLALAARGHHIRVAVPPRKHAPALSEQVAANPSITEVDCPARRKDAWAAGPAHLLRGIRNYYRFLEPRYEAASGLRQRAQRMLARVATDGRTTRATGECPMCGARLTGDQWGAILCALGDTERSHVGRLLELTESRIPADPSLCRFLETEQPHVVLTAPLARLGSHLADYVKAAQALRLPVAAPVVSWDDLSVAGCLHVIPDRLLVWSDIQRREAMALHGVPDARILVTGAPRFDALLTRQPSVDRTQFCTALDLVPERKTLLYLGSSEFVAPTERGFVDRWVAAVRGAGDEAVRRCNIVVRPHPNHRKDYLATPFGAGAGVALDVSDDPQALFDGLTHADAAVGLNTGALLEAGVLGTPVHTVLAPEFAEGQQRTVHFHHLLRANGGFVEVTDTLQAHVAMLAEAISASRPPDRTGGERLVWAGGHVGHATTMMVETIEGLGGPAQRGLRAWLRPSHPTTAEIGPVYPVRVEDDRLPVAGAQPAVSAPTIGDGERPEAAGSATPSGIESLLASTDLSWLADDATISEFWKKQIATARQRAGEDKSADDLRVADVVAQLGYGFKPLAPGRQLDEDPALQRVLERWQQVKPMLQRSGPKIPGLSLDEWEHLSSIAWLQHEQLFDDYVAFLRPFGVKSSMTVARHYYRTRVIERLCADHIAQDSLDVLEIGAGAGNLAVFLLARRLARSYVIVDLPEMLLNAAQNIIQYWPEATLHFDETPGVERPDTGCHVFLVRTSRIEDLAPSQFHVMLNFNSFMEMDRATRDMYIHGMYRTAREGAILYNVNRRQAKLPQPDGSLFDNNPLFYPYVGHDDVLFWEDDPFETAVRAWFGKRPSLSIARAERVRAPR